MPEGPGVKTSLISHKKLKFNLPVYARQEPKEPQPCQSAEAVEITFHPSVRGMMRMNSTALVAIVAWAFQEKLGVHLGYTPPGHMIRKGPLAGTPNSNKPPPYACVKIHVYIYIYISISLCLKQLSMHLHISIEKDIFGTPPPMWYAALRVGPLVVRYIATKKRVPALVEESADERSWIKPSCQGLLAGS